MIALHDRGALGFSLIEYQPQVKQGELKAIYEDENITVSAFPVTPKLITDKPSEDQVEILDDKSPLFAQANSSVGLTADEVRQAAVYHMFKRNSANLLVHMSFNIHILYCTSHLFQPEFLEDEVLADDREGRIPNWLHGEQLPSFSFPKTYPQSSTLAYVVIGSRPVRSPAENPRDRDTQPHPVVIILDVPSPGFIPSVLRSFNNEYAPFLYPGPEPTADYRVKAVYHMVGRGVIFNAQYFKFLLSFKPHTKVYIAIFCGFLSF